MNVLLTGASGFIGSHLARALRAAEYVVIESRRDLDARTAAVQADFTRDLSAREWLPKLRGVDVVINAVGILREHGNQTFERIHKRAPQALFAACVAAGVRRVIQISALGADLGVTRYFVSKRAADDYLATLPLDWTIVRPAMVFGPGGSSARLFERLAHMPVVPLPVVPLVPEPTPLPTPLPIPADSAPAAGLLPIDVVAPLRMQVSRSAPVKLPHTRDGSFARPVPTVF